MMQSNEQPMNDSNRPFKSSGKGDWPPSLFRLVLGAVFAAILSFIVLKTMVPIFVVPVEIATLPEQSPIWIYERYEKASYEVDGKNFSIVFGVIGAILGISCVVFAFGARSLKSIVIAAIGAGGLGAAGAFLSNWMFNNMRTNSGRTAMIMGVSLDGMMQSIVGYALLWGLIGLGVGVGIGSIRSFLKSLVAGVSGFCGGVLGAMLYVFLTAQISIGTVMNRVYPLDNASQAVWLALFTVLVAVCIALGSGEKRRKGAA